MRFEIVDVFAEAPLQGNQLAVVEDAAALTSERMQDIAREMNFSETTFVLERTDERAKVRIFTPGHELPFAGHPTLGTAWVLGRDQGSYILDLGVGPVEVAFDGSDGGSADSGGICWMAPPMPEVTGKIDPADAAALLNLKADDLDANYPATQIQVGPKFGFIGVRDLSVLENIRLNLDVRSLWRAGSPLAVSSYFVRRLPQTLPLGCSLTLVECGKTPPPAVLTALLRFTCAICVARPEAIWWWRKATI